MNPRTPLVGIPPSSSTAFYLVFRSASSGMGSSLYFQFGGSSLPSFFQNGTIIFREPPDFVEIATVILGVFGLHRFRKTGRFRKEKAGGNPDRGKISFSNPVETYSALIAAELVSFYLSLLSLPNHAKKSVC
ncbi:unnamed protein product [Nezara viridula]|uniref:Uncharacterized protein n=1 Tax=Nezara viridula TaxID=85310 RepID=A0A9P0HIB0_NEZVI|nr:unnamed protein product [Nezara viridula]